jgi:hypothetical protein
VLVLGPDETWQVQCPVCGGEGLVERRATPQEVDDGCELGIAYDPCPRCK